MADVHDQIRECWDRDSHTYDDSASHAISDPLEAAAWRAALLRALPERGAKVLDAGAGTGALSLLAAELGYDGDGARPVRGHARRRPGRRRRRAGSM